MSKVIGNTTLQPARTATVGRTLVARKPLPGPAVLLGYLVLIVVTAVAIFPFYWMLSGSFTPLGDLFASPPALWPRHPTLNNFGELFERIPFGRNLLNSFVISFCFAVLALFLSTLAGFGFAKYRFPGREVLFYLMIATLMLPDEVLVIPLFIVMSQIGWVDTYQGAVLPGVASAFGIFWMRQYMSSIPDEMLDAARIDGASEPQIYWRLILPVLGPGLAALAIILFMRSWNAFLWPLVVLRSEAMYTVPLSLARLIGLFEEPWNLVLAGSALATLPLILVFVLLQRQFIAGVMAGSLKS
jgi:ABC-type glycerol-3-phosphate transport system permease component